MMPSAAGVGILLIACMLAGCSPVMVNWTIGRASLEHVLHVTKLKTVITSKRFLKRLGPEVDLSCMLTRPELLLFSEDLKENKFGSFGTMGKLKALRMSKKSAEVIIRKYRLKEISSDREAVVLFTSGSESVPKGVPLSHGNVLSNICSMLEVAEVKDSDCMFGALPPFHSFGFTVTTLAPMVSGMKAAYYSNPTEYRRMAREIARWKPTIYLGTPTFVNGVLQAAKAERDKVAAAPEAQTVAKKSHATVVPITQHDTDWATASLRLCVTGAERTPDALYDFCADVHSPQIELIEGYGITETAPVLTANRPHRPRVGVGWTIPNTSLALLAVDPYLLKQYEVIAHCGADHIVEGMVGEQGVILAQGPGIFGAPEGYALAGVPFCSACPLSSGDIALASVMP